MAFHIVENNERRPTNETVGEHAVSRLTEPFYNTEKNVTTDNIFTSLKLVKPFRKGISIVAQ